MANSTKFLVYYCGILFLVVALGAFGREIIEDGKEEVEEEAMRRVDDRVTELPGQPKIEFNHYAGYIKLGPREDKALFYWFFEAQYSPSLKPLVLWLNGGPGCSSVAYGAAQELGPFLVRENGTQLILNKHSWNKVANILFLEAPVGVGFSYTNNTNDLHELGDKITAQDSHSFLINWFKRFPSYRSNEFYITGESYAGHYVPQLADLIYEGNKNATKASFINLKGIMIGNAVINDETDLSGMVDYAWSHAIISDQLHQSISACARSKETDPATARQCSEQFKGFLQAYSDIDIYSIYTPVCLTSSSPARKFTAGDVASDDFLRIQDIWKRLPSGYDPCTEEYAEKFFNREDVQIALHANVTKLSYPYTPCSRVIEGWNDSPDTVLPTIQKLLKGGLRIWIYSGDTDGRVPVTSTRYSVNKMRLKVEEEWRTWFHKSQVAGWVERYEGGLVLATIRGAGHQVPVFAPAQSLSLLIHFLSNHTLPGSRF